MQTAHQTPETPTDANAVRLTPIAGPALILPLPRGLTPVETPADAANRVANLLQGRPWVLVAAHGSYPGHDTTPIINVWTGAPGRLELLCAVVLTEGARLDLLEPLIRAAAGYGPADIARQGRAAA